MASFRGNSGLLTWESPSYSRPRLKLCVIPNQRSRWCGNLHRHCDSIRLKMEIATPGCGLVRNDREFGLAMTGKTMAYGPSYGSRISIRSIATLGGSSWISSTASPPPGDGAGSRGRMGRAMQKYRASSAA